MGKAYEKCKFPGCDGSNTGSRFGLCRKHDEMMRFFLWAIKVMESAEEGKTPSGLYLPKYGNSKKGGE